MRVIAKSRPLVSAFVGRDGARRDMARSIGILDRFLRASSVRLLNLSSGGFSAEGMTELRRDDLLWIDLPGLGLVRSEVRWRIEDRFGAAFLPNTDLRLRFVNGLPRR